MHPALRTAESPLDLLLTGTVARLLNVSAETVRLWERRGRLPAIRVDGRVRLFDRRVVERLARQRKLPPATKQRNSRHRLLPKPDQRSDAIGGVMGCRIDPIEALDRLFNERICRASPEDVNELLTQKLDLKRQMSKMSTKEAVARAAEFLSAQDAK